MAYITIPALPAGSDLTGLEQFEAVQSSTSVKLTALQIKSYISIQPSLSVNDATNAGVSSAATFLHTTSGVPAVGIGTAVTFATETQPSTNVNIATIGAVTTNVGSGTEAADVAVSTIAAGAIGEVARFTSTKRLGIGITTPTSPIHAVIDDAINNAITTVGTLTHNTSGSATVGIGTGLLFQTESLSGVAKSGAQIASVATSVSGGSENFDLVFQLMASGATAAEVARFTSTKRLGINTTTPSTALEALYEDGTTATVVAAARVTRASTGTPAIGIGTALEWATETASSTYVVGGAIYTQSTSLTGGAENFDLAIGVVSGGVATVEVVRVTSDKRVGINTTTPAVTLQAVVNNTVLNATTTVARLTHIVTGTPAIGIGAALDFEVENAAFINRVGAVISAEMTNVSNGTENFDLIFKTMSAGATATEKFKIGSSTITPSVQFSQFGAGVTPDATAYAKVGTNSLTVAPLLFDTTSPTLLTTAATGAFEYNGDALYFTPSPLERGVVPARQTYINTAGVRAGPNAINTAQAATVTGGSSTITVTTVPGAAIGNTGNLVIFAAAVIPTGLVAGVPYWVNWLTATTMTVSATQNGTPITPSTSGTTVTATFLFPILGSGLSSVGLSLAANTRYQYDLFFAISHTGAAATSVSYGLVNFTGTLSAHAYRVTSQNSTAAVSGNLTGLASTASNFISNYITSGFATTVVVTGVTAATANTTNLVFIQGQIDTVTACTYVMPVINMAVAPTLSSILQGAYMSIYPVGPVVSNTSVGSWAT
jgi:hypothetical protein